MSLQTLLPHLPAVLGALDLTQTDALQLLDAAALAEAHHPPTNPDMPALLVASPAIDAVRLRAILLNQYPPAHPLQTVYADPASEDIRVQPVALAALGEADQAWLALYVPTLPVASSVARFQETIAHLRAPEGCPWDRKQTHESLRPYLLEETYEVLDAIDAGDAGALREELGDLLLQIVLHSQIAVEADEFRMADIVAGINEKIVRRHPHVWGEVEVEDDQDVKVNWDKLKQAEKSAERVSRLEGVSNSLPALSQAYSYQDRAARVHFDWDTVDPVIAKVHEELHELLSTDVPAEQVHELGDLLFAAVNLARWLKIDPESALREANRRFFRRFYYIEQQALAQDRAIEEMSLDEMDALWDDAKANGL